MEIRGIEFQRRVVPSPEEVCVKYLAALSLLGLFLVGCDEDELAFDEFNDLLPLELDAYWQYDCNSDGAVWEIDVDAGAGDGGLESFDYSFTVDGAPSYHHDLALGDDGWYEAVDEPERPDLYLSLPAEVGFEWTHHYVVNTTVYDWLITYEGREDVSVPAGDFVATWKVTRQYDQVIDNGADEHHQIFSEYYAPGYGMVKSVIQETNGSETTINLVEYDLPSLVVEEEEG